MHSFEVWGKDQDYLVTLDNRNSFGSDSPFAYCISHHVKQIILGTDYVHAMTFVHYAEVSCNVPYRFAKPLRESMCMKMVLRKRIPVIMLLES